MAAVAGTVEERSPQAGFSAIEVLVALAIVAVMVGLAAPGISAYQTQQATRESARDVAGLLGKARSQALKDGVPYLVYFNDATAAARAIVVRDNDASYSITPGDSRQRVLLPLQQNPDVHALGEVAEPLWMQSVPMLDTMASSTQTAPAGPAGSSSGGPRTNPGPGSGSPGGPGINAGPGGGGPLSLSPATKPTLASILQAGTSFPIDRISSRPAVAFNTRGLPVSTDSPNSVGSGTGVFYLTNSRGALFGVIVNPLGGVGIHQWNRNAQTWN